MNKNFVFILIFTFCIGTICLINSEVVTSVEDFKDVLDIEKDLIDNLENYINENVIKLAYLKDKLQRSRDEYNKAKSDVDKYITNPMSAFSLLRRLAVDWLKLEQYMLQDPGEKYILEINEFRKLPKFPHSGDIEEAVTSIIKLQDAYKMTSADMASGLLNKIQYDFELSASDCNSIGFYAFKLNSHYFADLWFAEAIKRFKATKENQVLGLRLAKLLEIASVNKKKQGDLEGAIKYVDRIIEIYDDAIGAQEAKLNYQKELDENNANGVAKPYTGAPYYVPDYELYQRGCRGGLPNKPDKELYCKYLTKHHDFLKLAPFKIELANVDPPIIVFHDIVNDHEIEVIKNLAKPKLSRATVFNPETSKNEPAKDRISKFGWLNVTDISTLETIHQRIKDMTGQSLLIAELLQVLNYGLAGGQFIHLDSFEEPDSDKDFTTLGLVDGNRISTTLFYLSDVEQGGGTIFPMTKTVVFPKKGTAVFWYNLKPSGERDIKSRHAACPVLVGSKWVMTQWVRLWGETFTKPCPLNKDEHFQNISI